MILLFSGGLDSFCLWFLLKKPKCLYVEIRHKYQAVEKLSIRALQIATHNELDVKWATRLYLGNREERDGFIPLRNVYLVMVASEYSDQIVLGALKGERSPDKDGKFNGLTSNLLSHCLERKVRLLRPAANWTKAELVRRYLKAGGSVDLLKKTVSCYSSGRCGKCQSCFRRWAALTLNNIEETYDSDPREMIGNWKEAIRKYGWLSVLKTLPSNFDAFRALNRRA